MTAPIRIPPDPVDHYEAQRRKAEGVELLEDVLSDLMGGIVIDPQRQSDPAFKGDQARQRHWDALAADMRNPCPEDRR